MESNHRGIRQPASTHIPPSSSFIYFTEQARRSSAGYTGSELGRTQREQIRDYDHLQHLYPHSNSGSYPRPFPPSHGHYGHQQHLYAHPHSGSYPHLFPPSHPHGIQEAIQREIEMEQIRDEIIIYEIIRRRILEAEVRRELMVERLSLRRDTDEFPFGSSSAMGLDSPVRFSHMEARAEERSLDERFLLSHTEMERLSDRHESGGVEALPRQEGTAGLRISEVKPVSERGKGKEKIILLGKPDENVSGSKRSAVTPPPRVDTTESPSDDLLRKKPRAEWSCALCQVSATSERGLNEHLQGKKHKSKEAALKVQSAGKNYCIGFFPKKATKSIQVLGTVDPGSENRLKLTSESFPSQKYGEASMGRGDLPLLQESVNSDGLKKNELAVVENVQKNDNPKKKKFRFWCEICEVGVPSQKVMVAHQKGKKHVCRVQKSNQNGGAGPSNQKEKVVTVSMNHEGVTQNGKNIASDDVNEALEGARSEDHEPTDSAVPVDKNMAEDGGLLINPC